MAGIIENNKLRIKLSNTESTHSNIFKYNNFNKDVESRTSSTASYFINTNSEISNNVKNYLNCDNDEFFVDVIKTRNFIESMDKLLEIVLPSDFHGELREYSTYKEYYSNLTENFSIGRGIYSIDEANRSFLRFENMNDSVKRFRNIIIAIFTDLIVEKGDNKNIIYPVLKEGIVKKVKEEYLFNNKVKYWTYSPGEGGNEWEYCFNNNKMVIGFDELGDLNKISSKENIEELIKTTYNKENPYNDVMCVDDFINNLKKGDIVIAKIGMTKLLGYGVVLNDDYLYNEEKNSFKHERNVKWIKKGVWEIPNDLKFAQKTLTNITPYKEFTTKLLSIMNGDEKMKEKFGEWLLNLGLEQTTVNGYVSNISFTSREAIKEGIIHESIYNISDVNILDLTVKKLLKNKSFIQKKNEGHNRNTAALSNYRKFLATLAESQEVTVENNSDEYTKDDFLSEVFISEDKYDILVSNILNKKNVILQGAPGVGKTFMAKRLAYSILGNKDPNKVKLIQFHQSYAYEDFIEGYRPNSNGGFDLKSGKFLKICEQAREGLKNGEKYFLIIDEINRGNLSKIFGELLMLIETDKRGESLDLAYSNKPFSVPENLYIIGMMNTADRSLAIMDFALRRRFSFITIKPAFENEKFKEEFNNIYGNEFNYVLDLIDEINHIIKNDQSLKSGFMIGHSYFCQKYVDRKGTIDDIKNIFNFEIIPLLQEYWEYDDPKKYKDVLGKIKAKGIISEEQFEELTE